MKMLIASLRRHSLLFYRIGLFLAAIVLVVLIFPRGGKFKYEYQKGKPWMHDDLIAPFDFAVYKPVSELNAERETVIHLLKPYFVKNNQPLERNRAELIKALRQRFESSTPGEFDNIKLLALRAYDKVLETGIIELSPVLEGKPPDYPVMVLNGNVGMEVDLNELLTIQTADLFIKSQLLKYFGQVKTEMISGVISSFLFQNLLFDSDATEREKQQALSRISPTRGMIQRGERIISKGELVNSELLLVLDSFRKEYQLQLGTMFNRLGVLAGTTILVTLSLTVLFLFLLSFRPVIFWQNKSVIFILLVVLLMIFTISYVIRNQVNYLYLLPVCLVPILIRVFFDTRVALFVHLVVIIITGFLVPNGFEFVFLQLIAGIIAIVSVVQVNKRGQFIVSALYIFITYSAIYSGLNLMQQGDLSTADIQAYVMFGGSALLTLLAYPLIFIFEKAFGLLTDITLLELSDTNTALLRMLSEKAPGTFQHSIQVANIAEEVCRQIGGNGLLARVGALYHDIGKIDAPMYFVENQLTGINPHDELPYTESSRIIIRHVSRGIEIAQKHKLPEAVIDFIRTHHGTKRTEYFFSRQVLENPEGEVESHPFEYRGPIPYSKETAIVMMADSVEAASRSLQRPDVEKLSGLVEQIINKQLSENQFDNAEITMRDIHVIKKILKNKLINVYHARISYE